MPKTVCGSKWPPGLPLGLSIPPCTTFLDLPREIRDRVYHDALVALGPITVWSGSRDVSYSETPGKDVATETYTVEATDPVLGSLALNLFQCNAIVAHEALETFYRCNIFRVTGFEIWNPMYMWLRGIGSRNRQQLRTLTADLPYPEMLRLDIGGARIHRSHAPFPRVCSVGNHDATVRDWPHYLDPAIEACFRVLGESGARLVLTLWMGRYLPDVTFWEDDDDEVMCSWDSMDIPNEIERVREPYADRIDVLWECQWKKSKHIDQKEMIQRAGWKIISEKDVSNDNIYLVRRSHPTDKDHALGGGGN